MQFMGVSEDIKTLTIDLVKNTFSKFDIDHNGIISVKEFIEGCRNSGFNGTDEFLKKAFNLFDLDKNGIIDYKEFYCAMNYLTKIQ